MSLLGTLLVVFSAQAAVDDDNSNIASCYSAYHLQQQLDLSVNFGSSKQHQKTKVDLDIHVREIYVTKRYLLNKNFDSIKNIRSFVVFVKPNMSKIDGIEIDISERYQNPFLVFVDVDSGELINLKSTTKDSSVLNEYLSFFDLFQYSVRNGEYLYRNGNGWYQAEISNVRNKIGQLARKNVGYVKADNTSIVKQVVDSELFITLDKSQSECFYQKANGVEVFKRVLSANSFVDGESKMTVQADIKRALPLSHFFYTLTEDLALWPGFTRVEVITREEAFSRLPFFLAQLSSLTHDKSQFLNAMLTDKSVWPHLPEYVVANGLSEELSLKLFWALDRIDSTESVNALAAFVTSPLSDRDFYRAVMALGSTTAPFDQASVELLKNHMANFTNPEYADSEKLTFVRMLGAMANRRSNTDPQQSSELKSFLYSQVGGFGEDVNAAVIDAIGNLKDSIDLEGEEILLHELFTDSEKLRQSAASAFKRVPYKAKNSDIFIGQLVNESNTEIRSTLIEVMGRADKTDLVVKHQLLSLVNNSKSPELKNKSLGSLKKIDYNFEDNDILVLESKLRKETNKANQRLLASLILKHRRKQSNR